MRPLKYLLTRYEEPLALWLDSWFTPFMEERGGVTYIGRDSAPYLDRFYLLRLKWFSVFVHRFWQSDEAGLHCHPWANISIPLVGGYWEDHHDGARSLRRPGDVVFRSARELHRVRVRAGDRPCWSLFIKFKRQRNWGFIRNKESLGWRATGHAPSTTEFKGWWLPRPADPFREQHTETRKKL